jgi:diacylglycerol kinase (ATP)
MRRNSFLSSFRHAVHGATRDLFVQRNARVQFGCGVLAVVVGFLLRIDRLEWVAIVGCIVLVLALEAVNSAVEATVDLASPSHHELARRAKDLAAGAVLIASVGAVVIALLIFIPAIIART